MTERWDRIPLGDDISERWVGGIYTLSHIFIGDRLLVNTYFNVQKLVMLGVHAGLSRMMRWGESRGPPQFWQMTYALTNNHGLAKGSFS